MIGAEDIGDKHKKNKNDTKVIINKKTLTVSALILASLSVILVSSGPISYLVTNNTTIRAAAQTSPSSTTNAGESSSSAPSSAESTPPSSSASSSSAPTSSPSSTSPTSSSPSSSAPISSSENSGGNPHGGPPGLTKQNPGQSSGASPPPGQSFTPPGQCQGPEFGLCNGVCTDLYKSPNCGKCGNDCAVTLGNSVCTLGTCACGENNNVCEFPFGSGRYQCTNFQTDNINCGGCNTPTSPHQCTGGSSCKAGSCKCPAFTEMCNGQCVDPLDFDSDPANCGACSTPTSPHQCGGSTPFCVNSQCSSCPAGQHTFTCPPAPPGTPPGATSICVRDGCGGGLLNGACVQVCAPGDPL
jgi:hypothetical protein